MKPRHPITTLPENQVTPESIYRQRRRILKALGVGAATLALPARAGLLDLFSDSAKETATPPRPLPHTLSTRWHPELPLTPEAKVTSHNNFYEFGTDKADPIKHAQGLRTEPWTLKIDGLVNRPRTIDVWELIHNHPLEERIYRLRCVEAWSMVIPWLGLPLADLIQQAEPQGSAKYVAFETLYDPQQMPGQASRFTGGGIAYPYVEGLRLDEALHPLSFLAVGLYGKTLPPQNGAPIRLVVPWKYGFKSIKSIVRISLVDSQPPTTWNRSAPHEYGFYANVNPQVDHPRWSQASERFIGEGGLFGTTRQPTLLFNGYADDVASLYRGMDLRRYF